MGSGKIRKQSQKWKLSPKKVQKEEKKSRTKSKYFLLENIN